MPDFNAHNIFGPGPGFNGLSGDNGFPDFLLSEEDKEFEDKKEIKKIFNYYEDIAAQQIRVKRQKYKKNYQVAYGIIDPTDYGLSDEYYDDICLLGNKENIELNSIKLENFPIAPNIVNTLKQELTRKYINFFPKAIDSGSINEILEAQRLEAINIILEKKMLEFQQTLNPEETSSEEAYNQAMQRFNSIPEIVELKGKDYKLPIVEFSETVLERDKQRFNFEALSKDIFEMHLINGDRYCHVRDFESDYAPEFIKPENCAYVKSDLTKDVSDGLMFYWVENLDIQDIINKYGYLMSASQIESCKNIYHNRGNLKQDRSDIEPTDRLNSANRHNYYTLLSWISGDILNHGSVELSHMYFILPRKLGKVTIKAPNETPLKYIVTEDYYVDNKKNNVYGTDIKSKQTADTLIKGEHIDWFYTNELYYGMKIKSVSTENFTEYNNSDLWIKLEKVSYQGKTDGEFTGCKIPVFGGKVNWKNEDCNISIVESIKPFCIYHNYLMNKVKELTITELMPFYILNKDYLGSNSMEDTWQDSPVFKMISSGQETGLSIADITNNDTLNMQLGQGAVRIDVNRIDQIKMRYELAQLFKNEAYGLIGVSPQLLGQIQPDETATGVLQGINRSITQIQHLYDDHIELIKRIHQYMIELAQYKHFKKGEMIELSYMTSELQNVIFRMDPSNIPLTRKVLVHTVADTKSNEVLEKMKQYAMMDNTMGADGYEKMLILRANSDYKLLAQLKELKDKKDRIQQQQMEQQSQLQQQAIESAQIQIQAKQEFEARENQLDREVDILTAQIRALGFSNNPDANSNSEFDVIELTKLSQNTEKIKGDLDLKTKQFDEQKKKNYLDYQSKLQSVMNQKQLNRDNYDLKLKEFQTRLLEKQIEMKIAKTNKN